MTVTDEPRGRYDAAGGVPAAEGADGAGSSAVPSGSGPVGELTPRQIVAQLDEYVIGQEKAKRAVAIALRNRWRRRHVGDELRDEILPNNIIMIGPTGVGKTEIARRLARLAGAPFLKVEASKFTEVGYVGRDVESMIRDLVDVAVNLVRDEREEEVRAVAEERVEERLLDLLLPPVAGAPDRTSAAGGPSRSGGGPAGRPVVGVRDGVSGSAEGARGEGGADADEGPPPRSPFGRGTEEGSGRTFVVSSRGEVSTADRSAGDDVRVRGGSEGDAPNGAGPTVAGPAADAPSGGRSAGDEAGEARRLRTREKLRGLLRDGKLEERVVEVEVHESSVPLLDMNAPGMEGLDWNLGEILQEVMPRRTRRREVTVSEARRILTSEELEKLVDQEEVIDEALERTEEMGIVFLDELDKVAGERGAGGGVDVSREGVQRDLLPIVEGSTVPTKYGMVDTDHVLFIAAGAFHVASPSDLIPELQGRFPIRVELDSLDEKDFVRILREPKNALLSQYRALVATEGPELIFPDEAVAEVARIAAEVNRNTENIGARRLHTVLSTLLEGIMFDLPEEGAEGPIEVDAAFVRKRLAEVAEDENLRRYIL